MCIAITYLKGCNLKWHTSIQEYYGLPMEIEAEVGLNEDSINVYNVLHLTLSLGQKEQNHTPVRS